MYMSTGLSLLTALSSSEEFFYQLGLMQFGDYHRIKLDPPPPLRALVALAVDIEDTSASALSKPQIVDVRPCPSSRPPTLTVETDDRRHAHRAPRDARRVLCARDRREGARGGPAAAPQGVFAQPGQAASFPPTPRASSEAFSSRVLW